MRIPATIASAILAMIMTLFSSAAHAQFSNCQAIASTAPWFQLASFTNADSNDRFSVSITYVGHSTFRIEAPDGTVIATDFTGYGGDGPLPNVVTMNHAHTSHWTPYPDPAIEHVLRGWNPTGDGPAQHFLQLGETVIRNVATDIRRYGSVEKDGNSIFIFEIAGLCIGHLGHLHQPLSNEQIAQIGRLDILFVPIDGTFTMNQAEMMRVVERLRSSLVIPMHWWSEYSLATFVSQTSDDGLEIETSNNPTMTVSLNTLPDRPTMLVLPRQFPF